MPAEPHAAPPGVRAIPIGEFRRQIIAGEIPFAPSSIPGARTVLNIAEGLGVASTADLTPEFLDAFVAELASRGYTENTKRSYLGVLATACGVATRLGLVPENPHASRPTLTSAFHGFLKKIGPGDWNIQSMAQFDAVMRHLESRAAHDRHEYRLFVLCTIIAYTGLAVRDATALRVSDVDFEKGTLRIPHRDRRKRLTSWTPIMADPLKRVLETWLRVRGSMPTVHFDPERAAEAKRLKSEGLTHRAVADRLGVCVGTVKNILRGGPRKPRPESEYLLPKLFAVGDGPWTGHDPKHWPSLKAAAAAAGIPGLRLDDFRFIWREQVVPSLVTLRPHHALPLAKVPPVNLVDQQTPPEILGVPVGVLTKAEFNIIEALLSVYPKGLSWPELHKQSGHSEPQITVRRLKKKNALWDAILKAPAETTHGDCRIVAP